MPLTIDNDVLRTLIAFSDTGSFTRAAKLVGRTQSAVSMQMKRLEESVGRALFERVGRQMELNGDGKILVAYGRRILRLHDEAAARFSESRVAGSIRVGTPDDYAAEVLPMVLSRFAEMHPEVEMLIHCDQSARLRDLLDRGEVDIAIVSNEGGAIGHDAIRLSREPSVWVTSDRHATEKLDPLPLALFAAPCIFREHAISAFENMGKQFRVAVTSHSAMGLMGAVRCGLGVAPIARSTMMPGLRVLTEADGFPALPHIDIMLCRTRKAGNEAMRRLTDHLLASFEADQAA